MLYSTVLPAFVRTLEVRNETPVHISVRKETSMFKAYDKSIVRSL